MKEKHYNQCSAIGIVGGDQSPSPVSVLDGLTDRIWAAGVLVENLAGALRATNDSLFGALPEPCGNDARVGSQSCGKIEALTEAIAALERKLSLISEQLNRQSSI